MCCSRSKNTSSYRLDWHISWGHSREMLIASLSRDNAIRMSTVTATLGLYHHQPKEVMWGTDTRIGLRTAQPVSHETLLFFKGAEATVSVMKDASVECSAKEGDKFSQAMDNPSLAAWCREASNSVSSHKPQRCMDETALQGNGKDYNHNFTLLLQVKKYCSGRSPVALLPITKPTAHRLFLSTAVLSAQIITKEGPPSKQAFQINHSLPAFVRKSCFDSEISKQYQRHLQDRYSTWNSAAKRAQDKEYLSHTKQEASEVSPYTSLCTVQCFKDSSLLYNIINII